MTKIRKSANSDICTITPIPIEGSTYHQEVREKVSITAIRTQQQQHRMTVFDLVITALVK